MLRSEEAERLGDTEEVTLVRLSSKRQTGRQTVAQLCLLLVVCVLRVTKPVLLCCQNM